MCLQVVMALMEARANIGAVDIIGWTALMIAASNGHIKVRSWGQPFTSTVFRAEAQFNVFATAKLTFYD